MDKREYGSYEEVHSMLVEAMQEACTKDESGNYLTPEADMSFLYEDVQPTRKKNTYFSNFNKVAAIIVIMLLGLNAAILITGSVESYSDGGLLHRIHEGARGIFTDEDPEQFVEVDETGEIFIINDFDQIDDAKNFWPGLYVPEYIPEGYELNELKVSKSVSGEYSAEYDFKNHQDTLEINMYNYDILNKALSLDEGKIIELDNRTIHFYIDKKYNVNVMDVYFNGYIVNIYGKCSESELLTIAEKINP